MSSTRTKIMIAVIVSSFVLFGIGGAVFAQSNSRARIVSVAGARMDTVDSPSYIPGKSWGDLGAEQFTTLPTGSSSKGLWVWTPITAVSLSSLSSRTQIVNCWRNIKRLPSGVRLQVGKNFAKENPNFHFLTDGRCALSPNVISTAGENPPKAFDMQWFGTGLTGTPPVGSSSCFGGDPLNNHCGIETNITVPGMMPPYGPLPPIMSAR